MPSAKHYLDAYWEATFPVDAEAIIRNAGIEVAVHSHEMTSYLQYRGGKARIAVYGKDKNQANYKLAFFLGLFDQTCGEMNATYEEKPGFYSTETIDLKIMNSNNFAVALLMPERILNFAIVERGLTTISKLATAFGVSEVAMRKRLQQIRVL